ncbi:MAG: hypothetical protein KF819_16035 [Labilithrix sp.]|nr:hypothetical protein [Labilithrix sp.]
MHTARLAVGILLGWALVGCSDDATSSSPPPAPTSAADAGAPPASAGVYIAVVRGKLAGATLAEAQAMHDEIARGGEAAAKAAGDFAHDAFLGTKMLDSIENEFLGIDQWNDGAKMQGFYADPAFQQAFGKLFAEPPAVEYFVHAPTWTGWGDMRSGKPHDPHFVHLAIGTLANTDVTKNEAAHNAVAAGGKDPSLGAGNLAHVVFLGLADERRFVAVDIWSKGDAIEGFYSNPQFRQVFLPLFESVKEPVYQSTKWHSW